MFVISCLVLLFKLNLLQRGGTLLCSHVDIFRKHCFPFLNTNSTLITSSHWPCVRSTYRNLRTSNIVKRQADYEEELRNLTADLPPHNEEFYRGLSIGSSRLLELEWKQIIVWQAKPEDWPYYDPALWLSAWPLNNFPHQLFPEYVDEHGILSYLFEDAAFAQFSVLRWFFRFSGGVAVQQAFGTYMNAGLHTIVTNDLRWPDVAAVDVYHMDNQIGYPHLVWAPLTFDRWVSFCAYDQNEIASLQFLIFGTAFAPENSTPMGQPASHAIISDIVTRHENTLVRARRPLVLTYPNHNFKALLGTLYGQMVLDFVSNFANALAKRDEEGVIETVKAIREVGLVYVNRPPLRPHYDIWFRLEDVNPPPNTNLRALNIIEDELRRAARLSEIGVAPVEEPASPPIRQSRSSQSIRSLHATQAPSSRYQAFRSDAVTHSATAPSAYSLIPLRTTGTTIFTLESSTRPSNTAMSTRLPRCCGIFPVPHWCRCDRKGIFAR